jgi:hypothetical protein
MELEELRAGMTHPGGAWTQAATWYSDDQKLVAVSARGHRHRAIDLLAFGLQRLEGRELHLVVPRAAVNPTRARAAFLHPTVYVHVSQRTAIGDAEPPMSCQEANAFYRRLGDVAPTLEWDVSGWPPWLVDLVDWLESRRVERVRTTGLYTWHYRGRQILYVRPSQGGAYELIAGVNYSAPGNGRPPPVKFEISATGTLAPDELEQVKAALDAAIDRRRTGEDSGHREHLLQAAIGTDPSMIGMTNLRRELPAWRPKQKPRRGRGFIDFLARDVDRVGHVVETKVGPDAQLGIQAIDYWAWADAHREHLAGVLDADPERSFELDIVLGLSAKPALHPAAAATLRGLRHLIVWRCHTVRTWDTIAQPRQLLAPTADPLPHGRLPSGF